MFPWTRPRNVRRLAPAALLMLLGACDIPTALPRWTTTFVVPLDSARVTVASLLPSAVQVADGSAFQLSLQPVTFSRSLGEICGAPCTLAAGQTVPKPAFTVTFGAQVPLPTDVVGAGVSAGQLRVRLSHNFSFDPLRPSATARGHLVITAVSAGRTLARDSVPGEGVAFPAATALERVLALAPGRLDGPVDVTVRLHSPAGDPVRIDPTQRFTVTATPEAIRLSDVQVRVQNRTVSAAQVQLDLDDIDAAVLDQVRGGALRVEVANPFAVAGTLDVAITAPGTAVRRSVQIASGTTAYRLELSEAEIRSFLGSPDVRITVSGTVSAPSGTVTLTPAQALVVRARLELILGSQEGA